MRQTKIEINISNLRYNINKIKEYSKQCELIGVVKANAYGHGIIEVARILRDENIDILAVAFASEAKLLRENGDNGEILIMAQGYDSEVNMIVDYNLQVASGSISHLKALSEAGISSNTKLKVHLFIDTGMHRDGFLINEIDEVLELTQSLKGIEIVGLMSHYLASEDLESDTSNKQQNLFKETLNKIKNTLKYIHLSNSSGILNYNNSFATHVRPGIALHGLMPDEKLAIMFGLKPTLTLKTKISLVKEVKKGEIVGYSFKYKAEKDIKVGLISIGYGDGYSVALTNKAECLINGKRYKLIGSNCMDQCMIDISESYIKIGDEVILIGKQGNDEITVYELAEKANTISYEITTSLLPRIPRVYVS